MLVRSNRGPAFRAYRATAQAGLGTDVFTKAQLANESFDPDNYFDAVTNFRWQPNKPGYYRMSAGAAVATPTADQRWFVALFKNGAIFGQTLGHAPSADDHGEPVSDLIPLNGTTDFVELHVRSSASGKSLAGGEATTWMAGAWSRPL